MDNFESNFFIYFFKFFPPVLTNCILPNSSDRLIFVKRQAKDGRYFIKNTSVRQAKFKFSATKNFNFAKKNWTAGQWGHYRWKYWGRIIFRAPCRTFVFMQLTGLAKWFKCPKQLNNALNVHYITEKRAKYGRFSTNACLDGRIFRWLKSSLDGRLLYTGTALS